MISTWTKMNTSNTKAKSTQILIISERITTTSDQKHRTWFCKLNKPKSLNWRKYLRKIWSENGKKPCSHTMMDLKNIVTNTSKFRAIQWQLRLIRLKKSMLCMLNKFLPKGGNRKELLSIITLVRIQKVIVVRFLMKRPEPTSQILKKDLEFWN
jgi:hypothetical protein